MLQNSSKFRNQNVQKFGYVFHDTKGQNHVRKLKTQSYVLNEICTAIHWRDCCGKENSSKLHQNMAGRIFRTGSVCSFIVNKAGQFLCDDIKMAGKKQNVAPMWKRVMKNVDIDEPTSYLNHVYLGCTQRECKPNQTIIEQYTKMFESRVFGEQQKITGMAKTSHTNRSVVKRHGRTCSKMF